jgi:hypothetical protein
MQMLSISRNPVLTGAGWAGDDKGIHDSIPHARDSQYEYNNDVRKMYRYTIPVKE